jgi:hypothetical protein
MSGPISNGTVVAESDDTEPAWREWSKRSEPRRSQIMP